MTIDPYAAQIAKQNVTGAQERTKAALQKFEEDSVRVRESSDKFYGSLALFSGGTVALSVTFLGYLKSVSGKTVLYPKVLVSAWIVLMVCVVASLFCQLLNSYYVHFSRLGIYVQNLLDMKETFAEEMNNLNIVNASPDEKQADKQRYAEEAEARRKDLKWARRRESISSALWTTFGWVARLSFPIGLGLLVFFAAKNM